MECVQIGSATLYHGDSVAALLSGERFEFSSLVTDPPYSSGGMFRGDRAGRKTSEKYQSSGQRGNFLEFSGDNRDQRGYLAWCALWLSACHALLPDGGMACVFTDWRQLPVTTDAFQAGGLTWRGIAVWDKTEGARPQRGRFRNQCEYVVWGGKGGVPDGPCLPGVFRVSAASERREHIAAKPVAVMSALMPLCGDTVFDPFMGSGTTGVAAVMAGKRFIGIEVTRGAFDIACKRIEAAQAQGGLFA